MENSKEQEMASQTPMGKVWRVVISTMLGTALLSYAWHGMEMLRVEAMHTREANSVRENIAKLTFYRDSLRTQYAATTSTEAL